MEDSAEWRKRRALDAGIAQVSKALETLDTALYVIERAGEGQWFGRMRSASVLLSEAAQALRAERDKGQRVDTARP